jgi:hypothetical protein
MNSSEIARYTFNVNSDKRSSGTNTDLTLAIRNTISLKSTNSKFFIEVHSCNVPFSFYQLSSDINTLTCVFTDLYGGTKTSNITLTVGNYTTISILTELSSKLIAMASISASGYAGYTAELNFTYSTQTSKSTFQMTSPFGRSIKMNFSTNTLLGNFFGFNTDQTISTVLTVVSTNVCVANPVNYLLVRSGNMIQSYNYEFVVETNVFSDIIYKVPVSTGQNTWLVELGDSDPTQIANDHITSINLYLTTNLTYTPIDLQGLVWSISFSIVEKQIPAYTSLTTTLVSNLPVQTSQANMSPEEIAKLEKEYDDNIAKLESYKKRLEAKQIM